MTIPNVVVSAPSQIFTLPHSFAAIAGGSIYIGQINTDPTLAANQIQVYVQNDDGSTTAVSQPISIGAGGYPEHNGTIAKFVTVEGQSMAVMDANGVQQFYYPNVLKYDPDLLSQRLDSDQDGMGDALVVVKQPFAGAIARTIHDKFSSDVVSVYDFGVKGDGITDDTNALQEFLTYCYIEKVKGIATQGVFLISSTINIYHPSIIDFSGSRIDCENINSSLGVSIIPYTLNSGNDIDLRMSIINGLHITGKVNGERGDTSYSVTGLQIGQLETVTNGDVAPITINELKIEGFKVGIEFLNSIQNIIINRIFIGKCWSRALSSRVVSAGGEYLTLNGGKIYQNVSGDIVNPAYSFYASFDDATISPPLLALGVTFRDVFFIDNDKDFFWNTYLDTLLFDNCHFENKNLNSFGLYIAQWRRSSIIFNNCRFFDYSPQSDTSFIPIGKKSLIDVLQQAEGAITLIGGMVNGYSRGFTIVNRLPESMGDEDYLDVYIRLSTMQIAGRISPITYNGPEMLQNCGFEKGDLSNWYTQNFGGGGLSLSVSDEISRTGTYSLKAVGSLSVGNATIASEVYQQFDISPGRQVLASAWFKFSSGTFGRAYVNVTFYNSNGQYSPAIKSYKGVAILYSNVEDWKQSFVSIRSPSGSQFVRISLIVEQTDSTLYIDDAYLCVQ